MGKLMVLGVGNLLLKDEGVGVHVAQELMKIDLPPQVEVIDGGTAAFDLIPLIATADRLIVIDALQGGGEPGAIYRIAPEEITMTKEQDVSLHDTNLIEILNMAAIIGKKPETVIYGIEPAEISQSMDLSEEIKGKIPILIELIKQEISKGEK